MGFWGISFPVFYKAFDGMQPKNARKKIEAIQRIIKAWKFVLKGTKTHDLPTSIYYYPIKG